MSVRPDEHIRQMGGPAALPRANGELVFAAPWEGRAFGVALALCEQGLSPWRSFSDRLVAEIAAADAARAPSGYYERWLAALEKLSIERGHITPAELDARTVEYASGQCDDD